jgi:cytochrome c biogenesis protein CcdA/glutaredoxin
MFFKLVLCFLFFCSLVLSDGFAKEALRVYTRPGCSHCEDAKHFLKDFELKHPDILISYYDIWDRPEYMQELQNYAREHGISQIAVPFFRGPNGHLIGFGAPEEMEGKILRLFERKSQDILTSVIHVPFIGKVDIANYTPLFLTVTLGLLDGFNPCAMWVLLILLSLLIHLKDRKRIFLIAGVFVVMSGVIYFLFMSSLLVFYDYMGMSRWFQILIGSLALFIGLVHIKDFFWFAKGFSLSIPNSFKTKIAQRSAKIVKLDSLWLALASAAALAFFVNFVELLCTAGLPAIYTQILAQNKIIGAERYLYLFVYTLFYMLDDALMVFIASWTLSQTRLQEKAGRWLKLVSGLVLLVLAVLMILFPEKLNFFS